ncbi:MAG: hypothetical protein ACWGQW_13950 [bacterium]
MTGECPKECQADRDIIHQLLDEIKEDRKETWRKAGVNVKWVIGILITILGAAFFLLWNGQVGNAMKIVEAHKRITVELGQFKHEITKEINELTLIMTRIDERTKKQSVREEDRHGDRPSN